MNIEFARRQMVRQQVRAWDVYDPAVLATLEAIPRERFVPEIYSALAFADTEIPIGHGERMMTPTLEGRLLQSLDIEPAHRVLEIGTGSGFLTACLANLAAEVLSIEIHDDLLAAARQRLEGLDITNVELTCADATAELPNERFDIIAVTGSVTELDSRFVECLEPGGRMFVVVGDDPTMEACLVVRSGDNEWHGESLFETRLKPLVNGAPEPEFTF